MLSVGDHFPTFTLANQSGKTVSLTDLTGSKSVIYFYPKDDTPGCTAEACDFQSYMADFAGAKVIGVSPDSVLKHIKFADKYGLKFPLLADPEKLLITACGLWKEKSFMGKKYMGVERTTYVLDENGIIVKIFEKVNPIGHAKDVAAYLGS